jgi:hypothetical protein
MCPIDGPSLIRPSHPDACASSGYVPQAAGGETADDPLLLLEEATMKTLRGGEDAFANDAFFLAPPPAVPMTTEPGNAPFPAELASPPSVVPSGNSNGNENYCDYRVMEGADIAADELLGDFLLDPVDWL